MAKGCSGNTHTQSQMNHHANQSNPNNAAHTAAMNNHSNQCNPNHSSSKSKQYNESKYNLLKSIKSSLLVFFCLSSSNYFILKFLK